MKMRQVSLFIEWLIIFIVTPFIIFLELVPLPKLAIMLIPFFYTLMIFFSIKSTPLKAVVTYRFIWIISIRLIISAALLLLLTYSLYPQKLFIVLKTRPLLLGVILVLYPVFSALPQEFIYRRFYFERYTSVFTSTKVLIGTNILTFSFLHIIYDNWLTVGLTFVAGIYFVYTYVKTKSFLLTWIEHSLYGQIIFLVGLGSFFYEGV